MAAKRALHPKSKTPTSAASKPKRPQAQRAGIARSQAPAATGAIDPLAPRRLATRQVAHLQRTVGNQALQRLTLQRQTPPQAQPRPAGLDRFTRFRFDWGRIHHEVQLPAALTTTLPAPIRGVGRLEFKLAINGPVVSFEATLNGKANVRLVAYSRFDAVSGMAAAGLKFGPGTTVRRTLDPLTARERIEKAGAQLAQAINNYQQTTGVPPAAAAEPGEPQSTFERLKAVGEAIKELYDTVQAMQGQGQVVPVLEVGAEARWSTGAGISPPGERDRQGDFFGLTATWRF